MIGRKQEINLQLNQILDSVLIAFAFWLSHSLRYHAHLWVQDVAWLEGVAWLGKLPPIPEFKEFFWLMAIIVPFTPITLEFQGFYRHPLQKTVWTSLRQMGRALLWIGVIIGGFVIFFKWTAQSRAVLLILASVAAGLLLFKEWCLKLYLRRKVLVEGWRERVVLAGLPSDIDALLETMPEENRMEIAVVDRIDISCQPVEDLIESFHQHAVERVIFAAGHLHFSKVEEAIKACETEGVEAWLSADFIKTSIARPNFDVLGTRPMLVFQSTPEAPWSLILKNLLDRIGAEILIALTFLFWIVAYVGIKLSSPGPAVFVQERGGRYGRPFRMFKFRTMEVGAEARQVDLEGENEMTGPVFKLENDPRIFGFGKFLRHWSIDELPQLLNVLRGEMSLVGPRPLPTYEVKKIEKSAQRRRLSVKPGLTCLWQVRGRNQITDFEDWVQMDLEYIDNWSVWLDCKILVKTIPVVFLGAGAR
ncbi:MAG: sugar transferase [Verrucomicrobiales bacterium]